MTMIKPQYAFVGWRFALAWVLASILGFAVGAVMGSAVAESITSMACTQSSSDSLVDRLTNLPCILPMLDLALLVVILGLAGGFMQWLVLRRRIVGLAGGRPPAHWASQSRWSQPWAWE